MYIKIRLAEQNDQAAIEDLNTLSSDKDLITYSEQKKGLFSLKEYFAEGGAFWVAEDKDVQKIVACVGLRKIKDSTGKVKALRVHPEYRGKGVAKLLMRFLENYCKKHNFKEIILGVNAKSHPAIKLYESLGFIKDFEKEIDQSITAIYYKKKLI